ncbi:MAG TPA: pyruvate kinase alpha/beta domain-containing protein [Clostridia bacterium]|nr:pyruvate kinase alpha/beta domain-containing protein [Clostridia bacterium]
MYFTEEGKVNTEKVVEMAINTAKERGIRHIVVASNTGATARYFLDSGLEVTCVTHAFGYGLPGTNEMNEEERADLISKGFKVLTTTHVLSGAERALSAKFGGISPAEIIAHTLKMFGQGVKVCTEISVMALDAGMIPFGESVVAVGGSGRGADTAVIIKPAHAKDILSTRIQEIICKPR